MTASARSVQITLTVDPTTDAEVARAWEVMGRVASGLTCDGIDATIRAYVFTEESEGVE